MKSRQISQNMLGASGRNFHAPVPTMLMPDAQNVSEINSTLPNFQWEVQN